MIQEARAAGCRDGLGPVQHVAGPLSEEGQRCIRCGHLILDYTGAMGVSDGPTHFIGFPEGPVVVDGSMAAAHYDPAAISCTDLGLPS